METKSNVKFRMQTDSELAPVLVSVYHRLYTLRHCIDALKANPEAEDTDLYVVSDAAGRPQDVGRVEEVRTYVRQITGFRSVTLIARPENWGASKSIGSAIRELLAKYGRLIFMEDDILPSRAYLSYMNQGLTIYENEPRVFAICGYKSRFRLPRNNSRDVFVLPRYSPWGSGLWAHKCCAVNREPGDWYAKLKQDKPEEFAFRQKYDPSFLAILKGDSEGRIKAGDVRVETHLIYSGQVCLYPSQTMTNVMNTDADAMHGGIRWIPDEPLALRAPRDIGKISLDCQKDIYKRFLIAKYPGRVKRWLNLLCSRGIVFTLKFLWIRIRGRDYGVPHGGGAE